MIWCNRDQELEGPELVLDKLPPSIEVELIRLTNHAHAKPGMHLQGQDRLLNKDSLDTDHLYLNFSTSDKDILTNS